MSVQLDRVVRDVESIVYYHLNDPNSNKEQFWRYDY